MGSGKVLSVDEIQRILRDDDRLKAENSAERIKWPNMEDKARLFKSIKSNSPEVVMSDRRKFKIRYVRGTHVFVSPANDQFVPCGWFNVSDLEKELSEEVL